MTKNTEILKSNNNNNKENAKTQDTILRSCIDEQVKIITQCNSIIEENQARLNVALETKEFYEKKLSTNIGNLNATNASSEQSSDSNIFLRLKNKPDSQRGKHRAFLKEQVLESLKKASKNPLFSVKGLMVGEIRDLILEGQENDFKASPNTIGHVVGDLVKESKVVCVNPEQTRHRRFKIIEDISDLV